MRIVYLALAWSVGIVLAERFLQITPTSWLILIVGTVVLAWWLRAERSYRWTVVCLLAFALGGLRLSLYPSTSVVASFNNTGGLTIEGVISGYPDRRDDRTLLRLDSQYLQAGGDLYQVSGTVLVQTVSAQLVPNLRYGDRIRATGQLIVPAEYDTFSYSDYLARSGVFSIMRRAVVERISADTGNPFLTALDQLRQRAQQEINRYLPEPQAGLLSGILLGNERGISPALDDAFSAVGASHVIAISGFNMAVIAALVSRTFGHWIRRRWLAISLTIAVLITYTIFVGANGAVVRAALMSSLLVIGEGLRRRTYVPASLAFAALLMSALNPTVLWDISFQLSFFATLGLALFTPALQTRLDALLIALFPPSVAGRLGGWLSEPIIVTLAALIFTLPLIAMYFGRVSLLVLPVNLLIVPIQAVLLMLGGAATVVALIGIAPLAQLLFWFTMALLSWTIEVVRLFAKLPFADVEFWLDARLVLLIFVIFIGGTIMQAAQPQWWFDLLRLIRRRSTVVTGVFASVVLIGLMVAIVRARPDGQLHVWFLNVGHSNAVLIQTPGGVHILIDGGRFPSRLLTALGDRLPFNDREIEVVVITQPDEYDFAALASVFARYDTGVVMTTGQPNQSPAYTELQSMLAEREVQNITSEYRLELDDGVVIEVLNPVEMPELQDSLNDSALALRVIYGEVAFLLPGDLSRTEQARLVESDSDLYAPVLQIPQHGARGQLDADFLAAVQPSVVVLQSDEANLLGDPDAEVLAQVAHVSLYRTDQHGTIHFWSDGQSLWAQPETLGD
jgi:competence protein ComEC